MNMLFLNRYLLFYRDDDGVNLDNNNVDNSDLDSHYNNYILYSY